MGRKTILATDGLAAELSEPTIRSHATGIQHRCYFGTELKEDAGVWSLDARVTTMKIDIPGFNPNGLSNDKFTLSSVPLSENHH